MNSSILTICSLAALILSSCNNNEAKELELREREIEIRERELGIENGSSEYNDSEDYFENNKEKSEEELKEDLYSRESASPSEYLSASYTYRVNLLANTIIEGKIYNSASVAGFKNVEITVYFKSKTDVVLGEETFTIMEFVPANGEVTFRHKIVGWWEDVASSTWEINSAESY